MRSACRCGIFEEVAAVYPTRWAASLILAVGLAAGALAQGRGFGVLGSPAFLLRRTEVQTDLKLSEDQKKSLMAALEKLAADNQGLRDKLQNASDDERRKLI